MTLSEGEGLRYGNALYVVPTGADAVVVSCAAGAAAIAACPEVAGSVEVTQGEVVDAGPSAAGASGLRDALTKLNTELKNHAFDLQRAKTAAAQRESANDLAGAYRTAARGVGKAPVGALAQPARDELAAALKAVGDGWGRYCGRGEGKQRRRHAQCVGEDRDRSRSCVEGAGGARTGRISDGEWWLRCSGRR